MVYSRASFYIKSPLIVFIMTTSVVKNLRILRMSWQNVLRVDLLGLLIRVMLTNGG